MSPATSGTRRSSSSAIAVERTAAFSAPRRSAWAPGIARARGRILPMLFMVIERFRDNDMLPIYKRLRDEGRMLPEGLTYVDSWVEPNFSRCFQLMECSALRLLQEWALRWRRTGGRFDVRPR